MRSRRLVIATATAAALATLGLAPPALAGGGPPAPTFITVGDFSRSEHTRDCTEVAPSHCNVIINNSLIVGITAHNRPKSGGMFVPITVGWQIINGTAVAGLDFSGPTSGTVTVTPNNQHINFSVPLVNDSVAEPSETFIVRLTSSSVPADISDTGTQTIIDGDQFPDDCTLSQDLPAQTRSLTCTGRPAGQRWLILQPWIGWGIEVEYGNLVTGNGTSTAGYNMSPQPPQFYLVS